MSSGETNMDGLHMKCPSKNSGVKGMLPSCCRFGNGFFNSGAVLNSGAMLGNISEKSEVHSYVHFCFALYRHTLTYATEKNTLFLWKQESIWF